MAIMLPSLREERRRPIRRSCRSSRRPASSCRCRSTSATLEAGTIVWRDPDTGERFETPVTGGHVKLQWKPDWAMRWAALGVDYEMSGKDLIDSVKLAAQICRALGAPPPEGFNYELFLDENGQKISKSKGNGLTIDEWLTYAPTESLGLYMFQKPKTAKKLYFDVIPQGGRRVLHLPRRPIRRQDWKERLGNPVWHMHDGNPPVDRPAGAVRAAAQPRQRLERAEQGVLWGFISRYAPGVTPETHPELDRLVGYAIRYFDDFVKPKKVYRAPDEVEREALASSRDSAWRAAGRRRRRGDPERRAQRRARDRALPGSCQAEPGRRARRVGRLLPDDLPGADRPGARPALRLLRRALRHRRDARADRTGAGRRAGGLRR